ncbi:MAG: hypothetical protein EOO17_01970 [Chloroflexi bacterium]|nr:MAG: hypothetical protein EOO17_01970 [Chloroflexota bacterium]
MTVILYVLFLFAFIALLLVNAVQLRRTSISRFELNKRISNGDTAAKQIVHRESLLADLQSLQRVIIAVLVVLVVILAIAASGWLMGSIVALVIAIEFGFVSHRSFIQHFAQRQYERIEPKVMAFIDAHDWIIAPLRHIQHEDVALKLHSTEEFFHLLQQTDVLDAAQKQSIRSALELDDKTIGDSMVLFANVTTIDRAELLGPLVLDDLHKTGQSKFPVTNKSGDIIGVLDIRHMLTVDAGKHSMTAEKAMTPGIATLDRDAPLSKAMRQFVTEQPGLIMITDGDTKLGFVDPISVAEDYTGHSFSS